MKKNREELNAEDLDPYKSDKLSKWPSWLKILLLKYWAAAAAFYFFANANPLIMANDENAFEFYWVWVSLGLGLFMEYFVKTFVKLMNNSRDNAFRFNLINLKGVLSLFLNIVYAFIITIPIMALQYFLQVKCGLVINLFGATAEAGIEPITCGFLYLFCDGLVILVKFAIRRIKQINKFRKDEAKAKLIMEQIMKKNSESNDLQLSEGK